MKSKTGATLLLIGIFLLGAVTGALSHYLYESQTEASSARRPSAKGPFNVVEDLSVGLKLNAEQTEKLKIIIDHSRERYRALSQQFRPHYQAIRMETREEIRQILRDDQKARFEEIMKEHDARRKNGKPSSRK